MKSKFLTKKQVVSSFLEIYDGPRGDKVWKHSAWLDYVDTLCQDGQVLQSQYDNWTNPFSK
jgi:hypothetical protein